LLPDLESKRNETDRAGPKGAAFFVPMTTRQKITSPHNERLKELRKLHDRQQRDRSGLFFAEGEDMLSEAVRHGRYPQSVFYDAGAADTGDGALAGLPGDVDCFPTEREALDRAGSLGSGSRVIGVWRQLWSELDDLEGVDIAIYLHDVADPGNVGATIRSALALVPSAVVLSPQSADPFGPKAVRASMGAIFGQPVVRASFEEVRGRFEGHRAVALSPRQGKALRELDLGSTTLFCLGSERAGLPSVIASDCDEVAHVPLRAGGSESLNVAMTATLCLYESAVAAAHKIVSSNG
jgi:TrmH family RNA methyltransferase